MRRLERIGADFGIDFWSRVACGASGPICSFKLSDRLVGDAVRQTVVRKLKGRVEIPNIGIGLIEKD